MCMSEDLNFFSKIIGEARVRKIQSMKDYQSRPQSIGSPNYTRKMFKPKSNSQHQKYFSFT